MMVYQNLGGFRQSSLSLEILATNSNSKAMKPESRRNVIHYIFELIPHVGLDFYKVSEALSGRTIGIY